MKKEWLVSFCLTFAVCANAQSKADSQAATDAMLENRRLEQQAMAQQMAAEREANNQQAQYAFAQAAAQRAEVQKILSRDPWRRINGATNLCNAPGWFEFQGVIQEVLANGIIFKGHWGAILTVNTYLVNDTHLTSTRVSNSANTQNSQSTSSTDKNSTTFNQSSAANANGSVVTDTGYTRPKIYGDDIFYVDNFPYPASPQQGYEEMMAYESGYFSYTNSARQIITVHKLDYGTPCTKIWTPEEIRAADSRTAAQERALKANQQLADSGDAFGLLRMGERYRDGDGVPKDLNKAHDYFTKAAAAGSSTAADDLSKLNRVLTNSLTIH